MNVVQAAGDPIQLMSSESTGSVIKDLMKISYKRVQKNSPEFATVYESIDQSVDVQLSTFIFHAAPEPVVSLYDFIMTTFVPQSPEQPANTTLSAIVISDEGELALSAKDTGTIKVSVRLDSVQGWSFLRKSTTSVLTATFSYAPQ
jgi:vacuolar protein sorting-associated protein 13A/C